MALLLLGSAAREPGQTEEAPRFRPKVHLLIRSLSPLSICMHPQHQHLLTDGATSCRGDGRVVRALPLGLCRSCGADYRIGAFQVTDAMLRTAKGKQRSPEDLDIRQVGAVKLAAEEAQTEHMERMYLYPGALEDLVLEEDGELPVSARSYAVCPQCLQAHPVTETASGSTQEACPFCGYQGERPQFVAFLRGSKCPVCQAQGRGRRPEIITLLRSGAASSVSVLAQSLFPHLSPAGEGQPDEKRMLIFADSRQDTAHQAGYLRDRHQVFTRRQIVYQTLREHETQSGDPVALTNLAREVFIATRNQHGTDQPGNRAIALGSDRRVH